MKDILKNALKLFGRIAVINILCFFLVLSIVSIAVAMFGDQASPVGYGVIIQISTLLILAGFIYPIFWDRGYKDRNLVLIGNQEADPLKGLKCGLFAIIPAVLSVPVFALIKKFPAALFKMLNAVFYPLLDALTRGTDKFYQLSIWKFIVIVLIYLIIPAISAIGYYLGFKDISVGEKFTYKKTK